MILRIKADLTAEDREAWRRIAVRRNKNLRSGYGLSLVLWLAMKLLGLLLLVFSGYLLCFSIKGETFLLIKICCSVEAGVWGYFGIGLIRLFFLPPKRPRCLPAWDFPPAGMPDATVRAAFFGDGCFVFWESVTKTRLGYSAVTGAWEDKGRFYLFFEDRPPLVLPKRSLGRWMPEDFRDFLERTLEVPVERM